MLLQKIKNCSAYTGIAKFTGNSVGLKPAEVDSCTGKPAICR